MNLTLSKYVGAGSRANPFRPAVEGASIDLRPDCTKRDGYALVNTEERVRGLKLGDGFKDTFGFRIRNRVHDLLGVDVSRVRRFDVLAAKLLLEPNGWGSLRPTHERFEIWLGGLVWEFPLIRGGASDNFNRADANLTAPWVQLRPINGGTGAVRSNAVKNVGAGTDTFYSYASAAVTADQYSQFKTVATVLGDVGPMVREQNAGGSDNDNCGYVLSCQSEFAAKFMTGVFSTLSGVISDYSSSTNPGDTVGIRAVGSTITAYRNAFVDYTTNNPSTDTAIPGTGGTGYGQPGLFFFDNTTSVDDWEGGDYPPSSSAVQVLSMQPHISGHGVW